MNLDVLAQNVDLNTPLHIAVRQTTDTSFPTVRKLVEMVRPSPRKLGILFALKNKHGRTVLEECDELRPEFAEPLKAYLKPIDDTIPKDFTYAGITLTPQQVQIVQSRRNVQSLLAYFEWFDSMCSA